MININTFSSQIIILSLISFIFKKYYFLQLLVPLLITNGVFILIYFSIYFNGFNHPSSIVKKHEKKLMIFYTLIHYWPFILFYFYDKNSLDNSRFSILYSLSLSLFLIIIYVCLYGISQYKYLNMKKNHLYIYVPLLLLITTIYKRQKSVIN